MEAGSGRVDNLALLPTLDEKSLLEELRTRYGREIIYVSTAFAYTRTGARTGHIACLPDVTLYNAYVSCM